MNNLFTFLTDLAVNPHGQIDFAQNPQAVMMSAGLSEIEQNALASNIGVNETCSSKGYQPTFFMREPDSDPVPDSEPDENQ